MKRNIHSRSLDLACNRCGVFSVVLVDILPAESVPSAVSEFAASSVTELPVLDAFRSL
jgi:hypothetical protein